MQLKFAIASQNKVQQRITINTNGCLVIKIHRTLSLCTNKCFSCFILCIQFAAAEREQWSLMNYLKLSDV